MGSPDTGNQGCQNGTSSSCRNHLHPIKQFLLNNQERNFAHKHILWFLLKGRKNSNPAVSGLLCKDSLCAAFSNDKQTFSSSPLSQVTLLAQAASQTLCQTGWWRNHCSLWCLMSRIHPGVAHEPRQKNQKARALANPSPYHSVSIIRNALPKLNHCSSANKITNISSDTASGHYRPRDWRRNKLKRNNMS